VQLDADDLSRRISSPSADSAASFADASFADASFADASFADASERASERASDACSHEYGTDGRRTAPRTYTLR
jgi:hypothetical protein